MPISHWQRLFPVALIFVAASGAHARQPNGLRWERIHTYNAAPSAVFAKLGLTHSVKNGYTRDGKQGVPDPTFPPGLTDVVPYDADKLLLVRGTPGGLQLFRARVSAADRLIPPVHLHTELFRSGGDASSLGVQDVSRVGDGVRTQVSLGDGDTARVYQITERANPDGTVWIACRVSLPLPDQSGHAPTGPVFIPERIWTDPMSRKTRLGETVQFDDLASVRQAAARRLGVTGTDAGEDYVLRVTLTAE
jgi:hypothetical protein